MSSPKITHYISGGTTRCVQAAFRMIIESTQGVDIGETHADTLTGYVEGRGTWPFRMLLSFANLGFHVINHENFNFQKFVTNPESAIKDQVQDDHVTQLILAETDLAAETQAVQNCIQSPQIKLIQGIPTFNDLKEQIALGRFVMCNVDLQVLEGKPEREGHILIIAAVNDEIVVAHDPGPHGSLDRQFKRDLFEKAWTSPSPNIPNYISVWECGTVGPF